MKNELLDSFSDIFANLIEPREDVLLEREMSPIYLPFIDGIDTSIRFDYGIRYKWGESDVMLCFKFLSSDEPVSRDTCKWWVWETMQLDSNIYVCIVSERGYSSEALSYVYHKRVDLGGRLLLAKYSGESSGAFIVNRQWSDYVDKHGRTGVLTDYGKCLGVAINQGEELYNPVGILLRLGIPVKEKYIFRCDPIRKEELERRTSSILNGLGITRSDFLEQDILAKIIDREGLHLEREEMSEEFFARYDYHRHAIIMNSRYSTSEPRYRFTLAHELGHYYLHKSLLERYDMRIFESLDTIQVTGGSIDDYRRLELQANQFASCLLMPYKMFIEYADKVIAELGIRKSYIHDDNQYSPSEGNFNRRLADTFVTRMAEKYHVSKEAARYRLMVLDKLHVDEQVKMIKEYI